MSKPKTPQPLLIPISPCIKYYYSKPIKNHNNNNNCNNNINIIPRPSSAETATSKSSDDEEPEPATPALHWPASMAWLSGTGHSLCHLFTHVDHHHKKHPSSPHHEPPSTLGILSFETARIITRLVSLYRSLSDDDIHRLRTEVMRSRGVAYLNSRDETYLLSLAGAERMDDLNASADAVARLSRKCSDHGPVGFGALYADLKQGAIDTRRFEYECKNVAKIVERMEKLVSVTANLYAALESLTELEHSERKIHRWNKNLDAKQCGKATNFELFHQKMAFLRKEVQHYREISLWSQTFDRIVGFMARLVCVVFARVVTVFGPYVSGLRLSPRCSRAVPNYCLLEERKFHQHRKWASKSGPTTPHECCKKGLTLTSWLPWRKQHDHHHHHHHHQQHHHYHHHHHHHHHHRTFHPDDIPRLDTASFDDYDGATGSDIGTNHNAVLGLAPVSTVGGSALAVRYANVIITAERCLHAPDTVNDDTREGLYEMLPGRLRGTVRSKLRSHWLKKKEELAEGCDGHALAMGWKDALEEMMAWLGPMAHDTLTWQAERNYERQRYLEGSKSAVLLLQTLHFSDLEKTEAAIVEVLVGLSCFQRYENNRRRSAADHHHHFQPFLRQFS